MQRCRCPRRGRPRTRPALVSLVLLVVAAIGPSRADAQTYRWDDGGSGTDRNWDNTLNWFNITFGADNGVPPPGADVQFGIGYSAPIVVNLNGDRTVNSLAFGVPAQTALSGNTLTVTSGMITVYANQFSGTSSTLPPTGAAVTAPAIINSNLSLGAQGIFNVGGNVELQTNGLISGTGGVTRQGSGLWSIGGTANTFSNLTLQVNTSSGTVATTRFGDVGNATGGSIGVNAAGAANQISWSARNRLLFTGSAANQTLAKDIALVFTAGQAGVYSFETFNPLGGVGPNAGSLTLAGTILGDLTNGGTVSGNVLNFYAASPTDPNFAVVLAGNNSFRAPVTIQAGTLRLTNDNALGSSLTTVEFGTSITGAGTRADAALLVNAGRTITQSIAVNNPNNDTSIVYTLGGAADFTSGLATFTGPIALPTIASEGKGLTLAAHGTSTVIFGGQITGTTGSAGTQATKLVKVGTGTVRLNSNNPFTGEVEVRAGTLQLMTNFGQLTGTSGLVTVLTGGTIEFNNTVGAATTRINTNRPIDLAGGALSLVQNNTSLGATTVRPGAASIVINPNGAGNSTMTLASLTRPGAGSTMGGTLDVRAVNGGTLGSTARLIVTGGVPLTNGIVGGWATVNGSDWATYDGTNGVTAFTGYVPFASAGATDNALVGDGATTDAVAAVNSLKVATTTPGGSLNTGGTLTVGTGGVLQTGGQTYTIANPLSTGATDLVVTTDGTLTLGGAVTTAGLSKSGPGTLVLGANVTLTGTPALNVNAGTLMFQGNDRLLGDLRVTNVNSPAAVGIDLNGTNQRLGALSGTGSVAIGSGILTIHAPDTGGTVQLSGPVSGSGALVKTGIQAQRLSGDNPFTGTITVNRGPLTLTGVNAATGLITVKQVGDFSAILSLSGGGTLAAPSTQAIEIGPGGSLQLSNNDSTSVALGNRADRVADTRPIVLRGVLSFFGHPQPGHVATETLGPLSIQPGGFPGTSSGGTQIRVALAPGTPPTGGAAILTFAGVTRAAGSAVNFVNGTNSGTLGAAGVNPRLFFSSGMADGAVLPWGTVNSSSFAVYNSDGVTTNGNGIQALPEASQTPFASAGAANNARLNGGASLSGAKTVNTLQINSTGAGQSLALGANNLVIASGGLLKTGSQDYSITGTGTLGQAGTELIVHVASSTPFSPVLTVSAPIAASGLTKGGAGVLALAANNTYSGTTSVTAGLLEVRNPIGSAADSATGSGPVETFVGSFLYGGNATGTVGQITGPVSVGGTLLPGTPAATGILTIRNSVTFSPDRTASFFVPLTGNAVGSQYSRLRVIGGDVILNGALLNAAFSGTPSEPLTIIDVTGGTVSGLFTTTNGVVLNNGDVITTFNGVPWQVLYNANSVVVAPVPEPAGVLLFGAAGVAAVGWLRRRRAAVLSPLGSGFAGV